MKKTVTILAIALIVVAGAWYLIRKTNSAGSAGAPDSSSTVFNKKRLSLEDPASLWVITNKHHPLNPKNYAPDDLTAADIPLRLTAKDEEMQLRRPAAAALKKLYEGARQDGLELMLSSGYRSYNFQTGLYNRYVQQQGKATADTQSARPGFSEHQTGLAADVEPASRKCEIETCFADTPEGQWVAANAYKYGFILRYPKDQQAITGYIYEPWHLRYVGTDLSTELHKQNTPTLEQFFGLEAAPDYL